MYGFFRWWFLHALGRRKKHAFKTHPKTYHTLRERSLAPFKNHARRTLTEQILNVCISFPHHTPHPADDVVKKANCNVSYHLLVPISIGRWHISERKQTKTRPPRPPRSPRRSCHHHRRVISRFISCRPSPPPRVIDPISKGCTGCPADDLVKKQSLRIRHPTIPRSSLTPPPSPAEPSLPAVIDPI